MRKPAWIIVSTVAATILWTATASAETAFAPFTGNYDVVDQTCATNGEEDSCAVDTKQVSVMDSTVTDTAAVTLMPGSTISMSEYSYTGEYHEFRSATFHELNLGAMWNEETVIGDVVRLSSRTGRRVELKHSEEDAEGVFILTITSYSYGPDYASYTRAQSFVLNAK